MSHASSHRRRYGSAQRFQAPSAPPQGVIGAVQQLCQPSGLEAVGLLDPAATSHALALALGLGLAYALLATPALAAGPAAATGAVPEMSLPSCVRGSPPLKVPITAEKAQLDAGDRHRFQAAAEARYPLYQRGGLQPAQVLMLRRNGHWLYVTQGRDGRSGGPCVTAVFAAERFDFTPTWLAKYQPRPGDSDD
ncbi:MAG: hypothetical protein IPG93_22820 [Burkholderiales bacterium]|nr:hypothetical protein [Burkholderiales bacterium]